MDKNNSRRGGSGKASPFVTAVHGTRRGRDGSFTAVHGAGSMVIVTPTHPLTCSALHKTFRLGHTDLEILRGLEAEFAPGGLHTIQGASGTGKSTLLQILGGLERPDGGEVRWKAESIYGWSRGKLAAWRNLSVGFVFQAYHLFPELSALENVEFPARLARRGDSSQGARLLDQVGLGSRLHHRPSELSGGEQQRVAIARALRNGPALLLADEPTGNLDAATGHEIINLLLRLHEERGNCMIIVTHDDRIAALGQRSYRLEEGILKPGTRTSAEHSTQSP